MGYQAHRTYDLPPLSDIISLYHFFFAVLANINEISLEKKRENISETAKFILNDETKEAFQLPSRIR